MAGLAQTRGRRQRLGDVGQKYRAATTATPTDPPPTRLTPIATDSGMPSSIAPTTIALEPDWLYLNGRFADEG